MCASQASHSLVRLIQALARNSDGEGQTYMVYTELLTGGILHITYELKLLYDISLSSSHGRYCIKQRRIISNAKIDINTQYNNHGATQGSSSGARSMPMN